MACGLPAIAVDAHGPADIVEPRRDRLAGRARRRPRAGQRARRGRQPPGRAPPPRRERRRRRRRPLRLARARRSDVADALRRGDGRCSTQHRCARTPHKRAERCVMTQRVARPGIGFPRRPLLPCRSLPSPRMGFRVPPPVARLCLNVPRGRIGLYDPTYEHDACGVAMVAKLDGMPSHETVERAIVALENLEHRGAAGADPEYRRRRRNPAPAARRVHARRHRRGAAAARRLRRLRLLPPARAGAPRGARAAARGRPSRDEGQRVVGWRDVPVDKDYVGITANLYAPYVKQLVVAASDELAHDQDAFERKLYVIRRVAEIAAGPELVIPSFSQPHDRLQGHAHQPAAAGLLPRPAGPAHEVGAGARPLALLARTRSRAGSSRTRTG